MGPGDPFASRSAPPSATDHTSAPDRGPTPDRTSAPDRASDTNGPVRIQARMPDPAPTPSEPRGRAVVVGAAVGLVLGGLLVTVGIGPTLVVALCSAIGAALGALVKSAFVDGVDLGAAWRALRRR